MDNKIDLNNTNIPQQDELKHVFLHNFSHKEISLILKAVSQLYPHKEERKKIVFAKTTDQSLKMTVEEWVEDTGEDHIYLIKNPPNTTQKPVQNDTK